MDRIYTVYCRKCPVLKTFTVRFWIVNDAVLIVLGTRDNLNVFELLSSTQPENDETIRLYHGTNIDASEHICQYGINLNKSISSFRL